MKQEALQMLKCIVKDERKLKLIIKLYVGLIKKSMGKQTRGRRRLNLDNVVGGILYYLRTGCTWRCLPTIFGNYKSISGWFNLLCKKNIFSKQWTSTLTNLNENNKLRLGRILVDGSLTPVISNLPIGKRNPRIKNKRGINRQIATDARGVPIAFSLEKGNAHDSKFMIPLLDQINAAVELPYNFNTHGDKAYDATSIRWQISLMNGIACIPVRNHGFTTEYPKDKDRYRAKVERSIAWINRFKALVNIAIKKIENLFQAYSCVFTLIGIRFLGYKQIKNMIGSIKC